MVADYQILTHLDQDSNDKGYPVVKGAMSPVLAAKSIAEHFDGEWVGMARIDFSDDCFLRFAGLEKHFGRGMRWINDGDYHLHIFLYENSYYGVYTVDRGDKQYLISLVYPGVELDGIKVIDQVKKAYKYCTVSLRDTEIEEQFTEFVESACAVMRKYIEIFRKDYKEWKIKHNK
jgi:hypothetical protein